MNDSIRKRADKFTVKVVLVLLVCVLLLSALCGCTAPAPAVKPEQTAAEKKLSTMTLREKVGQLFVIRIESLDESLTAEEAQATYDNGVTGLTDAIKNRLLQYPAGGVILFGKNIVDPAQLTSLVTDLKSVDGVPLLLCIDEEGGRVARLANNDGFSLPKQPAATELALQGEEAVFKAGETIGEYLKDYGFNVDFAPVADVNSNPDNPVIGTRSFAATPEKVSTMVAAFLDGLHSQNVFGCIKHFPGHGDTASDTHTGTVILNKSWDIKESS